MAEDGCGVASAMHVSARRAEIESIRAHPKIASLLKFCKRHTRGCGKCMSVLVLVVFLGYQLLVLNVAVNDISNS